MTSEPERFLGRDPFSYSQDKERFQKELHQFHLNRGTQFFSLPTISGKPVDLYLLYSLVNKHGGFHKVSDKSLWSLIPCGLFHLPPACSNSELILKQIYMRYLYVYERVYIHGDDPDNPEDEEMSGGGRNSKSSGGRILVHQVPTRYNYRQHKVRPEQRVSAGLSTEMCKPNSYERLEKSLISGLPNEVDFAMNICCILSMDGPDTLRLLTHRRLVDILLANIGFFSAESAESSNLTSLYYNEWFPRSQASSAGSRDYTKFWYETTAFADLDYGSALLDLVSSFKYRHADEAYYKKLSDLTGREVLHLGRDHVTKDPVFNRVQQVLNILRNLSMSSCNAQAMADNDLALRFALVCSHSVYPQLRRDAMDLLVNISSKYTLPQVHLIHHTGRIHTQLILSCLNNWLNSEDKLDSHTGLLVLSALAQVESNEEVLTDSLTFDLYERVVSLARIYDLQLIIAALDTLYYLSEMGEISCEGIAAVSYSTEFLVNLVSVETHSFGEAALGGISVQDHRPPVTHLKQVMGPPAVPSQSQILHRQQQQQHQSLPTQLPSQHGQHHMAKPNQTSGTHYRTIQPKPTDPLAQSAPGVTGGGLIAAASARGQLVAASSENLANMKPEQVACNWLRANYESFPGETVFTAKVHQEYVLWLKRFAELQPVTPGQFVSCVQIIFPYSHLLVNGPESQISGIRWKPNRKAKPAPIAPGYQPITAGVQPPPYPHNQPHNSMCNTDGSQRSRSPGVSSSANEMLRSMLLSTTSSSVVTNNPRPGSPARTDPISPRTNNLRAISPRTNSPRRARSGSRRGSRSSSPHAVSTTESELPASPSCSASAGSNSLQLQVCGEAEKAAEVGSMAQIERVENTQSNTQHQPNSKQQDNNTTNTSRVEQINSQPTTSNDLKYNLNTKKSTHELNDSNNKLNKSPEEPNDSNNKLKEDIKDDNDSALGTSEPPSSTITNGNGHMTPSSEALSSPPHCNGNHSDTDSLLTEPGPAPAKSRRIDGVSGEEGGPPSGTQHKNGYINGLERMIENITDQKKMNNISSSNKCVTTSDSNLSNSDTTTPHEGNNNNNTNNNCNTPPVPSSSEQGQVCPPNSQTVPEASSPVSNKSSSNSSQGSRKRRHSSGVSDRGDQVTHRCLWEGCTASYSSCSLLRSHVSVSHTATAGRCLWAGCDKLERKRWALVSHVTERHTTDVALMKSLYNREKGVTPPALSTPQSAIYTEQAAKFAILRNIPKPPYQDFMDGREGPVTKHIRFTAALILRNICRYSATGRRLLKKHESHLSYIAGSSMEASSAVINCLWELQQSQQLSPQSAASTSAPSTESATENSNTS